MTNGGEVRDGKLYIDDEEEPLLEAGLPLDIAVEELSYVSRWSSPIVRARDVAFAERIREVRANRSENTMPPDEVGTDDFTDGDYGLESFHGKGRLAVGNLHVDNAHRLLPGDNPAILVTISAGRAEPWTAFVGAGSGIINMSFPQSVVEKLLATWSRRPLKSVTVTVQNRLWEKQSERANWNRTFRAGPKGTRLAVETIGWGEKWEPPRDQPRHDSPLPRRRWWSLG